MSSRRWFKKKAPAAQVKSKPTAEAGDEPAARPGARDAPDFESREFSLMVHGIDFSDLDIVINPEYFPEVRVEDVLEICVQGSSAPGAIMRVKSTAPVRGNLSISMSTSMAELFRLHRGAIVSVKFADPATVGLHRATVSFKEYVPRSEMFRFKAEAVGRCLYAGKSVTIASVTVHVKDLVGRGGDVLCGVVTPATKLVFRSRSAHVTVLVQLSKEMWEFADSGDLHMERAVRFIRMLLEKWRHLGVTHSLSLILFARTVVLGSPTPGRHRLPDGTEFEDFYQVVFSGLTVADWPSLLPSIKCELEAFPAKAGWGMEGSSEATPSIAQCGNMLEAVNLALDSCSLQHIDRDSHHVGNHIIVVSAGTATFDTCAPLASITKRRMNDMGASCDLIAVASKPMHHAPLLVLPAPPPPSHSQQGDMRGRTHSASALPLLSPSDMRPFHTDTPVLGDASRAGPRPLFKMPQWLMGQLFVDERHKLGTFVPLPRAQLLSRTGYRLSEGGVTIPAALLVVLQRLGRAPEEVSTYVLSGEGDAPGRGPKLERGLSELSLGSPAPSGTDMSSYWKLVVTHLPHAGSSDSLSQEPGALGPRFSPPLHSLPPRPAAIFTISTGSASPAHSPVVDAGGSDPSLSLLRVPSGPHQYAMMGVCRAPDVMRARQAQHDKTVFSRSGVKEREREVVKERHAPVRPRRSEGASTPVVESALFLSLRTGSQSVVGADASKDGVIPIAPTVETPQVGPSAPSFVSRASPRGPSPHPPPAHSPTDPFPSLSLSPPHSLLPPPVVDRTVPQLALTSSASRGVLFARDRHTVARAPFPHVPSAGGAEAMSSAVAPGQEASAEHPHHTCINPFQDHLVPPSHWTFDRRRWAHVYLKTHGPVVDTTAPARLEPMGMQEVNWPSLTEPAILPLTTDYLPPSAVLKDKEVFASVPHDYILYDSQTMGGASVPPPTVEIAVSAIQRFRWLYNARDPSLLPPPLVEPVLRLVGNRFDQDFQMVDADVAGNERHPWMEDVGAHPLCVLSTGSLIYAILFKEATSVVVQKFHCNSAEQHYASMEHGSSFKLWDPLLGTALPYTRTFKSSSRNFAFSGPVNWSALDQAACCVDDYRSGEVTLDPERVPFNQLAFLVIPVVAVTKAEPSMSMGSLEDVADAFFPDPSPEHDSPVGSPQHRTSPQHTEAHAAIIAFMDAVLSRQGPRTSPLPAASGGPGGIIKTKLDVKTRAGLMRTAELEYPSVCDARQSFLIRLRWASCASVIEELKQAFARTARRLGNVNLLPVPSATRYPLCSFVMDTTMSRPWSGPVRVNHLFTSAKGSSLLSYCAAAVGTCVPTEGLLEFEAACVDTLGLLPDVCEVGKGGGKGHVGDTLSPVPSPTLHHTRLLRSCVARAGWFRQYVHPTAGYCVRVDGDGVMWLPPLATPGREGPKQLFEALKQLCRALDL